MSTKTRTYAQEINIAANDLYNYVKDLPTGYVYKISTVVISGNTSYMSAYNFRNKPSSQSLSLSCFRLQDHGTVMLCVAFSTNISECSFYRNNVIQNISEDYTNLTYEYSYTWGFRIEIYKCID